MSHTTSWRETSHSQERSMRVLPTLYTCVRVPAYWSDSRTTMNAVRSRQSYHMPLLLSVSTMWCAVTDKPSGLSTGAALNFQATSTPYDNGRENLGTMDCGGSSVLNACAGQLARTCGFSLLTSVGARVPVRTTPHSGSYRLRATCVFSEAASQRTEDGGGDGRYARRARFPPGGRPCLHHAQPP